MLSIHAFTSNDSFYSLACEIYIGQIKQITFSFIKNINILAGLLLITVNQSAKPIAIYHVVQLNTWNDF